jgi:hypothetical protein
MRFHAKTPCLPLIENRLRMSQLSGELVPSGGHLWIPLEVPVDREGEGMFEVLLSQAEEVIRIAYCDAGETPSSGC